MQEFNFPRDLTDKVHVHTNFKFFNFFSKNVNFFLKTKRTSDGQFPLNN